MDEGADFGFCGDAYEAPMLLQDAQRLINWFCEVDRNDKAKMPIALLGTPGLNTIMDFSVTTGGLAVPVDGGIRGAWVLPGGTQCLWVAGSNLMISTLSVPATQASIAKFTTNFVGKLLTNSGQVSIRDNGVLFGGKGGYALIVDGTYGYYYRLSGFGTYTFTAGVTNGSATMSLPSLPAGLIISPTATLSDASGFIPGGTTISSIDYNTPALTMSAAATGTNASETITLTFSGFGQITDPGFFGADRAAFIEGWLVLNQPGTRTFYTTGPIPYTLMFPGSFFALKDSSTDNLITHQENNREWWGIGERTSEVWYNSGGANFAFTRLPGVGPQIGCAAKHSLARAGGSLVWLARNEQGENFIAMTQQYSWQRISNHAIEHAITSYPLVSDAQAYAYEEEGHLFYVITFPTADQTWVADLTYAPDRIFWHQRLAWDSTNGVYHRHASNCFVNFQDIRMVGDFQSFKVYQMSRQVYTDAGNVIRAQRRSPHVWSKENRERVFFGSLQIEFTPGVGLQTGQGSDPQVMLRWSNDGGVTWSNEHWLSIGKAGQTKFRAIQRRLSFARDRVWEATFSDPVPRDIIGATLFGEGEEQ